jgi:hypothetical protein
MDEKRTERMIKFTVEPFVGARPLRFGMRSNEVQELLGPPSVILPAYKGRTGERREVVNVGYDREGKLCEAVFLPGASLLYEEQDLFLTLDVIGFLRKFDSSPLLNVGFVIFPNIGIRLSGFHDGDDAQKSIAVTSKEYYGRGLAKRSKPYL